MFYHAFAGANASKIKPQYMNALGRQLVGYINGGIYILPTSEAMGKNRIGLTGFFARVQSCGQFVAIAVRKR